MNTAEWLISTCANGLASETLPPWPVRRTQFSNSCPIQSSLPWNHRNCLKGLNVRLSLDFTKEVNHDLSTPHLPTSWVLSVNLCAFCEQKLRFALTLVNHSPVAAFCFARLALSIARRHLLPFNTQCDWHAGNICMPPNLFIYVSFFSKSASSLLQEVKKLLLFFSQEKKLNIMC